MKKNDTEDNVELLEDSTRQGRIIERSVRNNSDTKLVRRLIPGDMKSGTCRMIK